MDPSQIVNIVVFIILICLSSFFSCTETAFLSANKIRMRNLAEEGDRRAKKVEKLLSNTDRLYSSILVGNNLVNIGASSLTTSIVISIFGNSASLVAAASGVVTLLILVFGEITPKTFATKNADRIALFMSGFVSFICFIFTPVVFLLNIITGFIIKLLGGNKDNGPTMTEEDLKTIVTVGHEEGVLEEEEKEMIHNVFEFGETEIKEIMTPRINVDSIPDDCSYQELMEIYKRGQFSRYPVHSESFDEIVGVLNVKDLLFFNIDPDEFEVKDYMRDTFVVYEFNEVGDVFAAMRKEHVSLAIVLDEYGVMSGIVTFEDIVEEIVGEIDDEYDDEDDDMIIKLSENEFLIDGSLNLNEVNDKVGTDFDSEDFESIGGLVLGEVSGVPEIDEEVQIDNVLFRIVKMHKNRIAQLKVTILEEEEEGEHR
ncbi:MULTISPECIES: CNNM domain-containing protein [unclassified Thomasclavelia]|uniref:HlyC/CorC family transporter n=1 Tax=unclassified Thomasclavelia TaxID=3025756 RepID=UPI000B368F6A|nr:MULTISPECIES: CNNM domain-containing protein [unclassified Thomasclavelia]OUP77791.1 hemolysin [Erysipelatoclostridium sp. An173]OUQ06805.1 hemolysin [Erysipelatoclostridium sp. An15]